MAVSKKGHLRYICSGCGAVVKVEVADVMQALAKAFRSFTPQTHKCNEREVNVAKLIGGTFTEGQKPA